jgi:prephenate dehydrogenase
VTRLAERLAVIGVGLIGASFALAVKRAGAVDFVIGCGRTKENLRAALEIGAIDDATTDPAEAARGADVVLLAVPVRSMAGLARGIGHVMKPGAIVTDAGSTKEIVLGELFALLPPYVHVVAGHPIAGRERTGATAADPDLFQGRRTILIQDKRTEAPALALVQKLWEACGAKVELMDAHQHDLVLGAVSHLPHLAAYALTDTVLAWDRETPMIHLSAGGLRDFTRIAASSPEMWRDVCLDNGPALTEAIDRYVRTLQEIRAEVEGQDGAALQARFERCREVRRRMDQGGK